MEFQWWMVAICIVIVFIVFQWWTNIGVTSVGKRFVDRVKDILIARGCFIEGDMVTCSTGFGNLGRRFNVRDAAHVVIDSLEADDMGQQNQQQPNGMNTLPYITPSGGGNSGQSQYTASNPPPTPPELIPIGTNVRQQSLVPDKPQAYGSGGGGYNPDSF